MRGAVGELESFRDQRQTSDYRVLSVRRVTDVELDLRDLDGLHKVDDPQLNLLMK